MMRTQSTTPAILSQSARTSRVASVGLSPSSESCSASSNIRSSNTRSISFRAASFTSESAKHSAADMCGLALTIRRGAIVNCGLKKIPQYGGPSPAVALAVEAPQAHHDGERTLSTVTP